MKILSQEEQGQVSGGFAQVIAIAGAVWLGIEVADAVYSAAKAFGEGFNEVRTKEA